jgi:glycosyltransferase involved in cell wall biosynthesis
MASDLIRLYESRFCVQSDALIATCDIDATRLHRLVPEKAVYVIPSSVDCRSYETLRCKTGSALLFYGQLNEPNNIAGLHWFMDEVLPRLKNALGARLPRIVVAGIFAPESLVARLNSSGIQTRVNPASVRQVLEEAAVVFFPVLGGRDARIKILESMAAGRPVVTTAHGTEGLTLSPGFDIAIADDADAFTSELLKLIESPALREEMGTNAARTVETRYDWRCVRGMVENLIASISRS